MTASEHSNPDTEGTYKNDMCHIRRSTSQLGEAGPKSLPFPINLNMLIIQFLLIRLFSLLVEFPAAF